jgi:hypothetical protein
MKRSMSVWHVAITAGLLVMFAIEGAPSLAASDPPPEVSQDGLHLTKQTRTRLVYLKPGATFTQYTRVAIVDCLVEFSKSWLQDYNKSTRDLSRQIDASDLERAKTSLSAQFKTIFTDELSRKGGYQIATEAAPDVLVLRPALINIEVNAPDLMTPGRSVTYAESSGQMTLFLELWDSATNVVLARVITAQADSNSYGRRTSSVTNKAAADRIIRGWARELRERLDMVSGKGKSQ